MKGLTPFHGSTNPSAFFFFSLSRNLNNYFWRVTSIISFIPPSPSLQVLCSPSHCFCQQMWTRALNNPIFLHHRSWNCCIPLHSFSSLLSRFLWKCYWLQNGVKLLSKCLQLQVMCFCLHVSYLYKCAKVECVFCKEQHGNVTTEMNSRMIAWFWNRYN